MGAVEDIFHFYTDEELGERIAHWEQDMTHDSLRETVLQEMYKSRDRRVDQQLLEWGT